MPSWTTQTTTSSAEAVSADGRYRAQGTVDFTAAEDTLRGMLGLVVPGVLLIVAPGALLTWVAVGRALAPVEAVRRETAEITAHDLHRRLPVPPARDEISRLAATLNATLDRLDRAVTRLRTFTGDVSHELRGPLTTLPTRLELALARPDRANWPEVATEALEDAGHLQDLVTDLLLLARLDAHHESHRHQVDLTALTHDLARRPGAAPHVDVDAREPAPVLGNAAHLTRLMTNVLDNARRHAATTAQIHLSTDDHDVILEVTDDGTGIPAEDRARLRPLHPPRRRPHPPGRRRRPRPGHRPLHRHHPRRHAHRPSPHRLSQRCPPRPAPAHSTPERQRGRRQ
ncbi:HAMP domain-containing sensor histidine kinase [Streptomyces sp. ID05-04B]|nr:HAMP domain-containing sensor histidine kinase [Streptomyces sp. ID05-04B]MDX5562678.1 HAMP domain-containing sensor histidine kinase [Streptomyces sp. ID05-04B]